MSEINTGGPAFPGPYANENGSIEALFKQQGMTLRDYFAAKAMQGLMPTNYIDSNAKVAYQMADAMLRAREAA